MNLGDSLGGGFVVTVANQSGGPTKEHDSYFECQRDIGGTRVTFSASTPEQLQAKVGSWLAEQKKGKKARKAIRETSDRLADDVAAFFAEMIRSEREVGVAVLADVKPLPSEPVAEPLDDDGLVTS